MQDNISKLYKAFSEEYDNFDTEDAFREYIGSADDAKISKLYKAFSEVYDNFDTEDDFKQYIGYSSSAAQQTDAANPSAPAAADGITDADRQAFEQTLAGTGQAVAQSAAARDRVGRMMDYQRADGGLNYGQVKKGNVRINPATNKPEQTWLTPGGGETTSKAMAEMEAQASRTPGIFEGEVSVVGQANIETEKIAELEARLNDLRSKKLAEAKERMGGGGYIPMASTAGGFMVDIYQQSVDKDPDVRALELAIEKRKEALRVLKNRNYVENGGDHGFWRAFGQRISRLRQWDFGATDIGEAITMLQMNRSADENRLSDEQKEAMLAMQREGEVSSQYGDFGTWANAGEITGDIVPFAVDLALTAGMTGAIEVGVKAGGKLATKAAVKMGAKKLTEEAFESVAEGYIKDAIRQGVKKGALNTVKGTMKGLKTFVAEEGFKKAVGTFARQDLAPWAIKATGVMVDDLMKGAVTAGTIQAAKTTASAIGTKLGGVVEDESGLRFENDRSWGGAIYDAVMSATKENASEMFGTHIDRPIDILFGAAGEKIAKEYATRLSKVWGAKAVSEMLTKAGGSRLGRDFADMRKAMAELFKINSVTGEIIEEYEGQLLSTMFMLDDATTKVPVLDDKGNQVYDADGNPVYEDRNNFFVSDWHSELWSGMLLSMGAMQLMPIGIAGTVGGYRMGRYSYAKRQVGKADELAARTFEGDTWERIRTMIDMTRNEDMGRLLHRVLTDSELSDAERKAVKNYMGCSMYFRGLNLSQLKEYNEADLSLEERQAVVDMHKSWMSGYDTDDAMDVADIINEKDNAALALAQYSGYQDAAEMEKEFDNYDTMDYIAMLRRNGADDEGIRLTIAYANARAAYDGMTQRQAELKEDYIQQNNEAVDASTHRGTGKIQKAVMKAGDRQVYIIDGRVSMTEDGTMVNSHVSDDAIIVRDAETGTIEMVSPDQILSVDAGIDAMELKEQLRADVEGTEPQTGYNSFVGRSLTSDEADVVVSKMETTAEAAPDLELTPENWVREFGEDGKVQTPLGEVKMGENQYLKLLKRNRQGYFGMVKPTLTSPDVVLEEYDPVDGAERDTKLLFIKTFVKADGSRIVHFESVTVQRDNMEISISGQELEGDAIKRKMQQDKVLHLGKKFSSSEWRLAEPQIEWSDLVPTPNSFVSDGKVTESPANEQAEGEENDLGGYISGLPEEYEPGMELELGDEEDLDRYAIVMGIGKLVNKRGEWVPELDPEGKMVVYLQGGETKAAYPKDLDERVVSYKIAEQPAAEPSATVAEKGTRTDENYIQNSGENIYQGEESAAPAGQPEQSAMPMTGKGEPDYYAVEPSRAHAYIYNESGLDRSDADDLVRTEFNEAQKALAKAKGKAEPKFGDRGIGTSIVKLNEARALRQQKIEDAQKSVEYWQAVKDEQAKVITKEHDERAAREAEMHDAAVAQVLAEREAARQAEAERKAVGNENPMPAITEKWNTAAKTDGAADEIVLPNGKSVSGHYVLHESGASSPSHQATAGWKQTDGFPMDVNDNTVNDRDYEHDIEAQRVTEQIAQQYDQRALQTPVVVSKDGVVLSGNGRTMAGELAAQAGTDGAYIDYLKKYAHKYGFTPEQVEAMQHPRMSFVPDEDMPYTAETFSAFNQQEMKSMSKTEQSVKLGKTVPDATFRKVLGIMNGFDTLGDFYADADASWDAIALMRDAGVIPQAQMSEMMDGRKLSATGREMLENMLIGKSFENNPEVVRMLTSVPSMRQSVIFALAEISNNVGLGEEFSLESELADAIKLCYEARTVGKYEHGERVSGYAQQLKLFAFEDEMQTVADINNATILMLADVLNDKRVSQLKKTLVLYNNEAASNASGQMDIFAGDVRKKEEILRDVLTLLNYGTKQDIETTQQAAIERRKAQSVQQDGVVEPSNQGGEQPVSERSERLRNSDRRGNNGHPAERQGDLAKAEGVRNISETEFDEDGQPFVKSSNGSTVFGEIGAETGLTPAPIKLSLGNSKYGLRHLEKRHGKQIIEAGYPSVESFVEYVATNYTRIKQGENSVGDANGTYLLQVVDEHNNTLYVELSSDSQYWGVNSGGIFREGYGNKKKEIWSASEAQNGQSVVDNTLRAEENSDILNTPNGDVSKSTGTSTIQTAASKPHGGVVSNTKVTDNSERKQRKEEKISEEDAFADKLEQEWDERIANYLYEHYPTQATVSGENKTESGRREREAMDNDPVLQKMLADKETEVRAALDKADAARRNRAGQEAAPTTESHGTEAEASWPKEQFTQFKAKHPDAMILFRDGEGHYVAYEQDADKLNEILGMGVARQNDGSRLAGFPTQALDTYLPRIIRAKQRVAIVEALDDPNTNGKTRKVIEDIKPGVQYRFVDENGRFEPTAEQRLAGEAVVELLKGAGIEVSMDAEEMRRVLEESAGRVQEMAVEEASARFDAQLEAFEKGEMRSSDKFELGTPSAIMIAAGIPDLPMTMRIRVLREHLNKHNLEISDVRGLVKALQRPIMIYQWGTNVKTHNIITDITTSDNRKVALAIKVGADGVVQEVNEIASIHGKSIERLLSDVNTEKSDFATENLRYVNKEKALEWLKLGAPLAHASTVQEANSESPEWLAMGAPLTPSQANQGLISAAKVVESFENPKVSDEILQKMTVWHGSPYEFEAFDHSHMGEGEGAQVHGWGTYVAKSENTSRNYAFVGSIANGGVNYVGERPSYGSYKDDVIKDIIGIMNRGASFEEAVGTGRRLWRNPLEPSHKEKRKALDSLKEEDFVTQRNLYEVEIPEDNGTNYLDEDTIIDDDEARRIVNEIIQGDKNCSRYLTNYLEQYLKKGSIDGRALYSLIRAEGYYTDAEAASKALASLGYKGIKYNGRRDGECYVIFNEADAKIVNHTQFLKTAQGEVYGFVKDGKVYLDPAKLNPETPIHEYSHLWDNGVREANPELWKKGVELMKAFDGGRLWKDVVNDPSYADIAHDDNLVASEVKARLTGERGAEYFERAAKEASKGDGMFDQAEKFSVIARVKDWLKDIWKATKEWLKKSAFADKWNKEELEKLTAEDFADMTLRDLKEGVNPREEARKVVQSDIIQKTNPAEDDYHTWIRKPGDVKSFREMLNEVERDHAEYGGMVYPDMTIGDLRKAKDSGYIMVYSSKPIKDGVFVTPSRMNAKDYAGGGKVYSKRVSVDDVAWIGQDEGQLAQVAPESRPMPMQMRFIGEKGAENADAVDGGVRMENLRVAEEMERKLADEVARKKERIEKLRKSEPLEFSGDEYRGKYELNSKSAGRYILDELRGKYTNKDTGEDIVISRTGAEKVVRHDGNSDIHLKSIAFIPEMIENAVFIDEAPNEKDKHEFSNYRYYVVGLKIDGEDYTAKLVIGEAPSGEKYYDHALTQIEKNSLISQIDPIEMRVYDHEAVKDEASGVPLLSGYKDKRLLQILQTNESEIAKKVKFATGWERGKDGKWRYEEGDDLLTDTQIEKMHDGSIRFLGDLMGDIQLFKDYPQLKGVGLAFYDSEDMNGNYGYYDHENQSIRIDNSLDDDKINRTFIHEIQHAIQHIEGFARGGNILSKKVLRQRMDALIERAKELNALIADAEAKGQPTTEYNKELDVLRSEFEGLQEMEDKDSYTIYQSLAGEVEARNAEHRIDMIKEERRGSLASETEDVARGEQIVTYSDGVSASMVEDKDLQKKLESEPTVKVYRAMQLINGKLYPPMAAKVGGEFVQPIELGRWEQADEHPELAKDGKFVLNKGNGTSLKAAYNPYLHTSRSPLNDQFSSAWNRGNLVTVEVEVPVSELTSDYKAEGAKDAVGEVEWKSGPVSGLLAKTGNPRKVILSRYDKPVRVIPDAEVADRIAEMVKGQGIGIPFNTVTPSLRDELVKRGVEITEPQKGNAGEAARGAWEEFRQKPFHGMVDDLFSNENVDKSKYSMTYFHVAETPSFMNQIGLNGAEFTMPFKAISSHIGKDADHRMTAEDWHNLPEALQNPFLITKYQGKDDRFRIYTNMLVNGKFVTVGVDVKKINQGKNKPVIEVNSIKTVFAKSGEIGAGETIVCYDERITPEQSSLLGGRNSHQYPTIQELNSVAKVVNSSETDKGNGGKVASPATESRGTEATALFTTRKLKEGEKSFVERKFRETRQFSFTAGEKLESADDVAFIFKELEEAAVENSFAVLVKDGQPTIIHLGMGTFTNTHVNIPALKVAYERVKPDKVYFVHNHPSGTLMPSREDYNVGYEIGRSLGVEPPGFESIIIDTLSGKYSTFDPLTRTYDVRDEKVMADGEHDVKVYSFDKQVFDREYDPERMPMRSGAQIAAFVSSQRLGKRDKINFLVFNNAMQLTANMFTTSTKIPKDVRKLADRIAHDAITFGGSVVVVYGSGINKTSENLEELRRRLGEIGVKMVDAIGVQEGGGYFSCAEEGMLGEPEVTYGGEVNDGAKRDRAERLSESFGMRPVIVESIGELKKMPAYKKADARTKARMLRSPGWFDPKTGSVTIVMPNNANADDVAATIFHEVVAHKGLRELVGEENYNDFLFEVYGHLDGETRRKVDEKAAKHGWRFDKAMDEYLGDLSEKGFDDFTKGERGIWQKLKDIVLKAIDKFLGTLKLPEWLKLGDNELRYMLWRSHKNLQRGKEDVIEQAQDIVKRGELGLGSEAFRMGDEPSTFVERQKQAEANKGTVMPGLNDAEVKVVDIPRHSYTGDIKEATRQAAEAAKAKYAPDGKAVTQDYNNHGVSFQYEISGSAIDEALNPKQARKSSDKGAHLSVIEHLDEIIGESIEVEEHPNYLKDNNGVRSTEIIEPTTLMHRFYGVAKISGQPYRVMTLMREDIRPQESNGVHAYEVTKVELLDNEPSSSSGVGTPLDKSPIAYPLAKVIQNIEKAYDKGKKLLEESQILDENDGLLFRDPGETGDIWSDVSLGFEERMTAAATRLASNHADDKRLKNDAMRAIGGNLANLRKAMSLQRNFDITTVKRVADLARILMDNGFLTGLNQQEVKRLLAAVKNSTGHEDVAASVQKVLDIMVDNQLSHAKQTLRQLVTIKGSKVDAKGVEVQGQLDPDGARTMQVFKKAYALPEEDINQRIAEAVNRMSSTDNTVADEAAIEYAGLNLALEYVQNIAASVAEEKELRDDLKQHAETASARDKATDAYRQYVESMQEAIRKNKTERVEAYYQLVGRMSDALRESLANAADFREAEKQRVREIQHNANSDMEGRPSDEHHKTTWKEKFVNNSFVSFGFAPLATFDQMLRMFGSKSANGEGYLYNRFMRGWVDAREQEIKGVKAKYAILDAKAAEVFGKRGMKWGDLISIERKMPKASVSFWNGGEMQERELSQGNLLYIYMVNKMLDGRIKLRKMGITEQDVENIADVLDPRFVQLADWLQEEFLVDTRNEYNETHKRMFGASMAAIENYFPLKILANARADKPEDLDNPHEGEGISTTTGSIIKRRRNALALDITGADAFSVILDHVAQMEHWNAYAEWNRDLNTLRTYRRFRNQVQNMTSVYGGGKELWKKFNDVCQMAAGTYRPPRAKLDEAAVNFAKGVTAAKVSFRIFTALKQLLSMPAYLPEARPDHMLTDLVNPIGAWRWSMENLPIFKERWASRMSGDPRLLKSDMDWKLWRSRIMEISSRLGMSPNAFVDALTVSIGAHSMYKTRKGQYISDGYSDEDADRMAKQDATILFNQTQQSSEGPFTSTMQVDRSWLSVLFTVFRNASMSYTRQLYDAVLNMKRNLTPGQRAESIAFMAKQMERDGIDADKARKSAGKKFNRQLLRDALRIGVFGYVMQLAWNLGAYLPYILFGDDEDEKQKMWDDVWAHSMFGSIEGLTGGDLMSQAGAIAVTGEGNPAYLSKDMPLTGDIMMAMKKLGKDNEGALSDMINLVVQSGIGVNPQSITDGVLAIMDACGDDPKLAHEATIAVMRILQVPQSQIDKMYFDEVGLSGDEISNYTPAQLAERYAHYKVKRGRIYAPWSWDDAEATDKQTEKADTAIKERAKKFGSKDANDAYNSYVESDEYKKQKDLERSYNKAIKEDYAKAAKIASERQSFGSAFNRYQTFKWMDKNLDDIVKCYMAAKRPEEASLCRDALEDYKTIIAKTLVDGYDEDSLGTLSDDILERFYDELSRMRGDE